MFEADTILLALALAADATAVCIAWSLAHGGNWRSGRALPWAFGIAQAGMAGIGYVVGAAAIGGLSEVCTWVAVVALAAIGLKMMWPKRKSDEPEDGVSPSSDDALKRRATFGVVATLAIATSLDALAAGVGLPGLTEWPLWALAWIGVVSVVLPALGLVLGIKLGARFGAWGERIGGAVLVALAVKTAWLG